MRIDIHSHIFNANAVPVSDFLTQHFEFPRDIAVPEVLALYAKLKTLGNDPNLTDEEELKELEESGPVDRRKARRWREELPNLKEIKNPGISARVKFLTSQSSSIAHYYKDLFRTDDHAAGAADPIDVTIALTIDFDSAFESKPEDDFLTQLKHAENVIQETKGKVRGFVGFDPRREDGLEIVDDYIRNRGFLGIKLYPALGFYPLGTNEKPQPQLESGPSPATIDHRLHALYAYAVEHDLAITAHCSSGGMKGGRRIVHDQVANGDESAHFFNYMGAPLNWLPVLEKYPRLKLNIAHWGGWRCWLPAPIEEYVEKTEKRLIERKVLTFTNWADEISRLLRSDKYPNLYTDLSYHAAPAMEEPYSKDPLKRIPAEEYPLRMIPLMREEKIRPRVLFGSDMPVLSQDCSLSDYWIGHEKMYRDHNMAKVFTQVSETNSLRFLKSKIHPHI